MLIKSSVPFLLTQTVSLLHRTSDLLFFAENIVFIYSKCCHAKYRFFQAVKFLGKLLFGKHKNYYKTFLFVDGKFCCSADNLRPGVLFFGGARNYIYFRTPTRKECLIAAYSEDKRVQNVQWVQYAVEGHSSPVYSFIRKKKSISTSYNAFLVCHHSGGVAFPPFSFLRSPFSKVFTFFLLNISKTGSHRMLRESRELGCNCIMLQCKATA